VAKRPQIVGCTTSPCTYRALFDAVQDIIYIRDLGGVILDMNQAGLRFLGKSKEHVLGRTLHGDTADERAMSLMETNLSLLEAGADRSTVELSDADGRRCLFEVTTTGIRDAAGQPIGAYGIMRPVQAWSGTTAPVRVASGLEQTTPAPMTGPEEISSWTPDD